MSEQDRYVVDPVPGEGETKQLEADSQGRVREAEGSDGEKVLSHPTQLGGTLEVFEVPDAGPSPETYSAVECEGFIILGLPL